MPDSINPDELQKISELFFPHFWETRVALRDGPRQLVHYTSAENAVRILTEKAFIMRSTVCMNDYREVQHGHDLVYRSFMENEKALLKRFIAAFDVTHPGAADDAFKLYDAHYQSNVFRTYVACLSEHDPENDSMGRLSMWRAYGRGRAGVALVLNKEPFFRNVPFVGFFASPVAYLRDKQVQEYLEKVVVSAAKEIEFLKTLKREQVVNSIFVLLMFSAICIKHHGFEEEREWRLIYLPGIFKSDLIADATITIDGIPQPVYRLPLSDRPEKGLTGIEIPALLSNVIIGPTQFPFPICEALAGILAGAGVERPFERIHVTNIPLRT